MGPREKPNYDCPRLVRESLTSLLSTYRNPHSSVAIGHNSCILQMSRLLQAVLAGFTAKYFVRAYHWRISSVSTNIWNFETFQIHESGKHVGIDDQILVSYAFQNSKVRHHWRIIISRTYVIISRIYVTFWRDATHVKIYISTWDKRRMYHVHRPATGGCRSA